MEIHPTSQKVREALAHLHAATGRSDLTSIIESYIQFQRERMTEMASRIITLEEQIIARPPERNWKTRFWEWLNGPKGTDV